MIQSARDFIFLLYCWSIASNSSYEYTHNTPYNCTAISSDPQPSPHCIDISCNRYFPSQPQYYPRSPRSWATSPSVHRTLTTRHLLPNKPSPGRIQCFCRWMTQVLSIRRGRIWWCTRAVTEIRGFWGRCCQLK